MRRIAIVLATAIAIIPSIRYLYELRYRWDPALQHSVCRSLACSDDLLLESAKTASQADQSKIPYVLANLAEAVRRNTVSPNLWCDLGQAMRQARRIEDARYCYARAVELGPANAPVLWRTALFYLRIKDKQNALKFMSQLLELVPEYKDLIFSIYAANIRDVSQTLEFGVPKQGRIAQEYFRYLLNNAAIDDVKRGWQGMAESHLVDRETAGTYVDFLISRGEFASAAKIWPTATGNETAYFRTNLIYNGDFEMEPLQKGFDWKFHTSRSVRIRRVSEMAFSGSSSMEIDFLGSENVEFNDFAQSVALAAGRYRFVAWIRTADLTTDQGIGFRLVDSSNPGGAVTTRILTGTHNWTPVELFVEHSGATRLLRIELVRHASWKFDNKIKGRVWIDNLSLTPLRSSPSATLPRQVSSN